MRVSVFFAWYDFWVGWFYDRQKKVLYINLLPCVVIKLVWRTIKVIPSAYNQWRSKMIHMMNKKEKKMAYKTVICLLKVPSGKYCYEWTGDRTICDHFDFGDDLPCKIFEMRPRKIEGKGLKKLAKCLKLKDK